MAEKEHRVSQRAVEKTTRVVIYTVLTVISVLWVFPFFYLILQSFAKYPDPKSIFPTEWTMANYGNLFTNSATPFFNWWINTFIIAFFTAA